MGQSGAVHPEGAPGRSIPSPPQPESSMASVKKGMKSFTDELSCQLHANTISCSLYVVVNAIRLF